MGIFNGSILFCIQLVRTKKYSSMSMKFIKLVYYGTVELHPRGEQWVIGLCATK